MKGNGMKGDYSGPDSQQLRVKLQNPLNDNNICVKINGNDAKFYIKDACVIFTVPKAKTEKPCHFVLSVMTK